MLSGGVCRKTVTLVKTFTDYVSPLPCNITKHTFLGKCGPTRHRLPQSCCFSTSNINLSSEYPEQKKVTENEDRKRGIFTNPRRERFTESDAGVVNGRTAFVKQVDTPPAIDDAEISAIKLLDPEFPWLAENLASGAEPQYHHLKTGIKTYHHKDRFSLKYRNCVLPELEVAYETWGELNERKDNAVMIAAGLSAGSHAKSHQDNPSPGWWEKFVGPGCAVDTNKYYVICTNNIGSCYGSSGPSSIDPQTGKPYATTFPILSLEDMINAQFLLLDHLGISKLHGMIGSSLGGMLSLAAAVFHPERVGRMVSISACAQSHPSSIAMRYLQRKAIMTDPAWNRGHYYDGAYPKMGMKLAREIATITYRSGPEWDGRFGRQRIQPDDEPSLCPMFQIESYINYQGESFCTKLDPNSLLYLSKAMDVFDLGETFGDLQSAMRRVVCPVMVIGVQTDILFPVWQQRELAKLLQDSGNEAVTYYELNSLYGHATFLLDLNGVGAGVKGFLETRMNGVDGTHKGDDHNKDLTHF